MLLKYTQAQKRMKLTGSGKPQRATGMMKLTSTMMNVVPRMHRKVIKNVASKRPNSTHRLPAASKRHELRPIPVVPVDPCDNSNDSGLGFDQHIDYPLPLQQPVIRFSDQEICWSERIPNLKRQRLDIKLESDDANDNFSFPTTLPQEQATSLGLCTMPSRITTSSPPSLTTQLSSITRDGRIQLQIVCQPEQQHRARYQTEGSRGAVKDRSGNGFPVVKLIGYDKPAIIQVFIGTDQGRVVPHMFYQACRVSGKNSTPCVEKKIDGTVVIEIETAPERDMIVTCDCVGILKERNVDVEHRFPDESPGRSKKKSTRCRMVFRTNVLLNDGTSETLQVTSQPIVCTQPPGIPEIGKKSLIACPATGGLELYVFGKNFLKDTRVVFQQDDDDDHWESVVQPDKEFLQQSHLVCTIPPYKYQDIQNPVTVRLVITSSGKNSEPHDFTYTPPNRYYNLFPVPLPVPQSISSAVSCDDAFSTSTTTLSGNKLVHPVMLWPSPLATSQPKNTSPNVDEEMPPPPPLLPLVVRRPSVPMIVPEAVAHEELKQETTETPQTSPVAQSATTQDSVNDTRTCAPSVSTLQEFVSEGSSLPPISVENYLTGLDMENNSVTSYTQKRLVKPQMMIDTGSSATQLHPISILSDCNPDLVHSQMMNDIPPQSSASQMLPSSVITNHNTASNLPQTHILTDMSPQHTTSHLNSPPIISNSGTIPSPVKQTRYTNSLLSPENNSQPISTSLLMTTDSPMQFSQSLEANRTATQCINDLLTSRNTAPELQQTSSATLISDPQTMRLSDLVVSSSVVQANTTERLDAFVNSAAESHISPGQSPLPPPVHISPVASDPSSSPPSSTSSITSQTAVSQEGTLINPLMQGVQTSCTNTSIANTSLCSLLTGPPMTTIQQSTPTTMKCDLSQTIHPNPLTSSARISDLMVSQSISSELLRTGMTVVQSNLPTSSRYNEEQNYSSTQVMETNLLNQVQQVKPEVKEEYMLIDIATTQCSVKSSQPDVRTTLTTSAVTTPSLETPQTAVKKNEEGIPLGSGIQELTQMSENDLISYINPSCFDQV